MTSERKSGKSSSEGKADFEVKHKTKEGEIRDIQIITQTITLSGRAFLHAIWRDITERKRTAEALKESERKFRTLFESANDAIFIIDLEGNFIDINRIAYERLGYTKEEMMSMSISQLDSPQYASTVALRIEQLKKDGHGVVEVAHRKKDGTIMPVEINVRIIDFGERKILFSIVRDITERKQAEVALKEINAKLQTLIRALPDAVFFKDTNCRYIMVNRAFEKLMGARQEAFIGKSDEDFMPADLAEGCRRSDEALMKNGSPVNVEDMMIGNDGIKIYLDSVKAPIYDSQGILLGIVGVSRDVTVRKRAEEELRFNSRIIENLSEGVCIIRASDGIIIYANPNFELMFGYDCGESLGKHVSVVNTPTDKNHEERAKKIIKSLNETGRWRGEVYSIKKDATTFWCYASVITFEHPEHGKVWITAHTDITERKRAEELLLYFQMAVSSATDAIGMSTPEGRHYYQNEAFTALFGLSIGEVNGVSGPPTTVYADEKAGWKVFDTIKKGGSYTGEVKMLNKERVERDIYLRAYSIKNKDGNIVGLVGMHTDITYQRQAEQKLRMSEHQLRESQKVARLGSWDLDLTITKLDWSEETYRLFDRDPENFVPSFDIFAQLVHPEDRDSMQTNFDRALASDETPYHVRVRIINDSGRQWVMEAFGEVRRDRNGKPLGIFGTAQDITERTLAEQALAKKTRSASGFEQKPRKEGRRGTPRPKKERANTDTAVEVGGDGTDARRHCAPVATASECCRARCAKYAGCL